MRDISLANAEIRSGLPPRQTKKATEVAFIRLAESEGFEPSMGDKAHTPLAGVRLRPLGQLSGRNKIVPLRPRAPGHVTRREWTKLVLGSAIRASPSTPGFAV